MTVAGPRTLTRHTRLKIANEPSPGIRHFRGARCAFCWRGLHDSQGNPSWDVIGGGGRIGFVCQGGCP